MPHYQKRESSALGAAKLSSLFNSGPLRIFEALFPFLNRLDLESDGDANHNQSKFASR